MREGLPHHNGLAVEFRSVDVPLMWKRAIRKYQCIGLALVVLGVGLPSALAAADYPICGEGRRVTCVVDGDTFWQARIKYRIADIDAPEVSHPSCAAEAERGRRATARLAVLLGGGAFEIQAQGLDRYGRTLATVSRGGRSIGGQLVREGLARRWGDRTGWCG